jgi:mono/diheme cytochrome c family protein
MPKRDPDHAHDIIRLNMWFAIASILLFISFVWMMWQDFGKDWKHYQAEFRRLDLAKTRAAESQETATLKSNPAYQKVLSEIAASETELKNQREQQRKAAEEQKDFQGTWYKADQQYKFKKAEYEAKRYDYEEAKAEHPKDAPELDKKLKQVFDELQARSAKLDEVNAQKAEIDARVDQFTKKVADLEKDRSKLATKLDRLSRKEATISPSLANTIRNLPMLDFLNPSIKIQQVVVTNQMEDLNFTTIPRVDRCMTCHVPIDQEGYTEGTEIPGYPKKIMQPFVSHPHLDLFVGSNSPHPIDKFGCTGCHMGRGRATEFISTVHMPDNEQEKQRWEKEYHWEQLHHWDTPMYPKSMVEASCIKCHQGVAMIPKADKINTARMLFIEYGCHGCHLTKGFEGLPKVGPDLRHISSKVSKDWAVKWVENPKAFRPTTRMPRYFHNSNNSSPEDVDRSHVEIRALVEFIFSKSDPINYPAYTNSGDPVNGQKLVRELGCVACHLMEGEKPSRVSTRRRFGPPLVNLGSKVKPEWLFNWLKEPRHYAPVTRMPNMRLSDQEAMDITAYLLSLHDRAWEAKPVPAPKQEYLKDEILSYLKRQYGLTAEQEYNKMPDQKKWAFLGEKLVQRYGCTGCHLIQGFENAKGIGTSLSEEGSKLVTKFDFGFVPIEHSVPAYITQKLHDPRSFDQDRVKRWDEKLIMPNFGFTDEEVKYLTMLILGLTKEQVPQEAQRNLTAREQIVEKGRWLVLEKNCVGCHDIDGWGGEVREVINEEGMAPPQLINEGEKAQSDWLFHFLKSPGHIRPWLKVRMPNFRLSDDEANTLVQFFMASANVGPFNASPDISVHLSEGQQIFTTFQCSSCHVVGGQSPEGKTAADLAPDLTMASSRLRADWIVKWLDDPQTLLPGTRMPDFFPEAAIPTILNGDSEQQRIALRNYLYSIGRGPQASISPVMPFRMPGQPEQPKQKAEAKPAAAGGTH